MRCLVSVVENAGWTRALVSGTHSVTQRRAGPGSAARDASGPPGKAAESDCTFHKDSTDHRNKCARAYDKVCRRLSYMRLLTESSKGQQRWSFVARGAEPFAIRSRRLSHVH